MNDRSIADNVSMLNEATSDEAARLSTGRRIGALEPFTAGMGAFFKAIAAEGRWKSGASGFASASIASMRQAVLLIKVYFAQRNGGA